METLGRMSVMEFPRERRRRSFSPRRSCCSTMSGTVSRSLDITPLGSPRSRTTSARVLYPAARQYSDPRDFGSGHVEEGREQFMSKRPKTIPKFSSEAAERAFWEKNDSAEYLDWSKARPAAFPNLKPSTKTISLRLREHLLDAIKVAANARDVPYQSLIKVWLQEKVHSR